MAKTEQTKIGTAGHRKVKNKRPNDEEDKTKALWRAGSEYDFRELGQARAHGEKQGDSHLFCAGFVFLSCFVL